MKAILSRIGLPAKAVKTQFVVSPVLIVGAFGLAIYNHDADAGAILPSTLISIPFILGAVLYNVLVLSLLEVWNKKIRVINYCVTSIPFMVWFSPFIYYGVDENAYPIAVSYGVLISLFFISNIVSYFLLPDDE